MSIESRRLRLPRSSGAQCIYIAIGLICANYAITTKASTYAHPSLTYFPTVLGRPFFSRIAALGEYPLKIPPLLLAICAYYWT